MYPESPKNLERRIRLLNGISEDEPLWRIAERPLYIWIQGLISAFSRRVVLDLGCGISVLGHVLLRDSQCVKYIGIDCSMTCLMYGADLSVEIPSARKSSLVGADFSDSLPLRDECADLAIACFSIYYAKEPSALALECRRVLRTQGALVIVGPDRGNKAELFEIMRSAGVDPSALPSERFHAGIARRVVEQFPRAEVFHLAEVIDFEEVDIFMEYYDLITCRSRSVWRTIFGDFSNIEQVRRHVAWAVDERIRKKGVFSLSRKYLAFVLFK